MTRLLWAIERLEGKKWVLLPNTVQVRRHHCAWDIKELLAESGVEYRIVSYERRKPKRAAGGERKG